MARRQNIEELNPYYTHTRMFQTCTYDTSMYVCDTYMLTRTKGFHTRVLRLEYRTNQVDQVAFSYFHFVTLLKRIPRWHGILTAGGVLKVIASTTLKDSQFCQRGFHVVKVHPVGFQRHDHKPVSELFVVELVHILIRIVVKHVFEVVISQVFDIK